MLGVIKNNLVVDVCGERMMVNLDQARVCRFREDGSEGCQMSSGIPQIPRLHESTSSSSGREKDNLQRRENFHQSSIAVYTVQRHQYHTRLRI